jgi:uracil-DNA glycosylase family 4
MQKRAEELPLSGIARWFFGAAELYPQVFDAGELGQLWYQTDISFQEPDLPEFVALLRAGLLKRLYQKVAQCEGCELAQFRLGLPVLDDGDYGNTPLPLGDASPRIPLGAYRAQIMVVGEGPGQFEQRTGQPFVSYTVLAGSRCAQACNRYETCYPGTPTPQTACQYDSIYRGVGKQLKEEGVGPTRERIQERVGLIQLERATQKGFRVHTAGTLLDQALLKAGLWREGWNSRMRLIPPEKRKPGMETQPGSVYVTNVLKCRSAALDPREPALQSPDGLRDVSPPHRDHLQACSPWLAIQLYLLQPRALILLGRAAIETVLGLKDPKVLTLRGQVVPGPQGIPTFIEVHPSYLLRKLAHGTDHTEETRTLLGEMAANFQQAKDLVAGNLPLPWDQPEPEAPDLEDLSLEGAVFLTATGVEG